VSLSRPSGTEFGGSSSHKDLATSEKVEQALNLSRSVGAPQLKSEWSSLAGVSGIREFQRGVLELQSGQERFVVLGVCQLSFYLVFSHNDLCRNGFGQVVVSERYLHIWIRSRPDDLVAPLGQVGGSYRDIAVKYDVGTVFGGGVGSEWKNGEDEGKGQDSFRHVYLLYLLPVFDSVEKHYVHWKRTAAS
jgi:hypothetical protein